MSSTKSAAQQSHSVHVRLARSAPVQKRAQVRVDRILLAVRAILLREGFGALTLPAICAEANVAVGTFYQYFPNKEAIVVAFYEAYLNRIRVSLEKFQAAHTDLGWRDFFTQLLQHVEREELRDPCVFELTSAMRMSSELEAAEAKNAAFVIEFFVAQLKRFGSIFDDAKLGRLARVLYEVHSALWTFREQAGPKFELEALHWQIVAYLALVGTAFEKSSKRSQNKPHIRRKSNHKG